MTFTSLNNIERIFAQENNKTITFYTIYIKTEGDYPYVYNVTQFTLTGNDTQIKGNYPIDEVFAVTAQYNPPYHVFQSSNETKIVHNVTKADYMNELDTRLKEMEVQKEIALDNCWTIDIEGGRPPIHTTC